MRLFSLMGAILADFTRIKWRMSRCERGVPRGILVERDRSSAAQGGQMTASAEITEQAGDQRVAVFAHVGDPHVLAVLLCRVLHMQPLDAVIAARHTPGVLPTPMTADQAQQFVSLLQEIGIQAAAVSARDLPDLADAQPLHHARLLDAGLEVVDLSGRPGQCLPWSQIGVIAVGRVPGEPLAHFVEQGRPSVLSAAPLPEVGRVSAGEHKVLELWLLTRAPAAYRLRHDQFNYETLGEAKTESATANFDRLVRDLTSRAVEVRRTPSTAAFLNHDLARYDFHTVAELEQQALLHWVLDHVVQALGAATSSTK
jgi:hypothetical protein